MARRRGRRACRTTRKRRAHRGRQRLTHAARPYEERPLCADSESSIRIALFIHEPHLRGRPAAQVGTRADWRKTWLRSPLDEASDESFLRVREPFVRWLADHAGERVTVEVRLAYELESSLRVEIDVRRSTAAGPRRTLHPRWRPRRRRDGHRDAGSARWSPGLTAPASAFRVRGISSRRRPRTGWSGAIEAGNSVSESWRGLHDADTR